MSWIEQVKVLALPGREGVSCVICIHSGRIAAGWDREGGQERQGLSCPLGPLPLPPGVSGLSPGSSCSCSTAWRPTTTGLVEGVYLYTLLALSVSPSSASSGST